MNLDAAITMSRPVEGAYNPDEERDAHGRWGGNEVGDLHGPKPLTKTVSKSGGEGKTGAMVTAYHGTSSAVLKSIAEEGLIPGKGQGADAWARKTDPNFPDTSFRKPSVFLTGSFKTAARFAQFAATVNPGSKPIMLRLSLPTAMAKGFKPDEMGGYLDAVRSEDPIPAKYITGYLRTQDKEWQSFDSKKLSAAAGTTHYTFVLYKHVKKVEAYSPDQERDKNGKWTKGGNDVFVSPNVEENTQMADAMKGIESDRQKNFEALAQKVIASVAGKGSVKGAVGLWADGAENSTHIVVRDPEQARYIGALLGKAANQKMVLNFTADPKGNQFLYQIQTKGDLGTIDKQCVAAGVENRTLEPVSGGVRVSVYDSDGTAASAVQKLAEDNGYTVKGIRGSGEWIGSWTSREEGNGEFQKVIDSYEKAHPEKAYRDALNFRGRDGAGGQSRFHRRHEASVEKQIAALQDVSPPKDERWQQMLRVKAQRYGKTTWKRNPLAQIVKPIEVLVFKSLPGDLADKMVQRAPIYAFHPRKLQSDQPVVAAEGVRHFLGGGKDTHQAVVLRTTKGLYVLNGNHRAVADLLAGKMLPARYVNLTAVSPPGWSGTISQMKDHPKITNPYALGWSMYKKGDTSHKTPERGHPGAKHVSPETRKARGKSLKKRKVKSAADSMGPGAIVKSSIEPHPFQGKKTPNGHGVGACKECGKPWKYKAHWRIAAEFDESEHPRDKTGKFADKGGGGDSTVERVTAKHTPVKKAKRLQELGFKLKSSDDKTDLWVDKKGNQLKVGYYNAPGQPHLRRFELQDADGKILERGHQFAKVEAILQPKGEQLEMFPDRVKPKNDDPVIAALEKKEKSAATSPVVGDVERTGGGINSTYRAQLADGTTVYFKSAAGEDNVGNRNFAAYPRGLQTEREVAFYQLAKTVGMGDLVTPTVARQLDGKEGVVSVAVKGKTAGKSGKQPGDCSTADVARIAALDYVAGNRDRHHGNWMVTNAGEATTGVPVKPVLIDHGLCFPNDDRVRGLFRGFIKEARNVEYLRQPIESPAKIGVTFMKNKPAILGMLKKQKMDEATISGVSNRIDDLAASKKWGDLQYAE